MKYLGKDKRKKSKTVKKKVKGGGLYDNPHASSTNPGKSMQYLLGKDMGKTATPIVNQQYNAIANTCATLMENAIEDIFEKLFNKFEAKTVIENLLLEGTTQALNNIAWEEKIKIYEPPEKTSAKTPVSEPSMKFLSKIDENNKSDPDRYNAKKIYDYNLNTHNPMTQFIETELLSTEKLQDYLNSTFSGDRNLWKYIESALVESKSVIQKSIHTKIEGLDINEDAIIKQMKKMKFVKENE